MGCEGPKIAIACQGGGSHTAFTAGVLSRLLEADRECEIIGLSGTSGGAICAFLSWYGLVHEDHDPGELLESFWDDIAASSPVDRTLNIGMQMTTQLRMSGVPVPEVSPFWNPSARWGQTHLRDLLEQHVDFDSVPEMADESELGLLISAIDVLSGDFQIFREADVTADAILASAADPHLFSPVEIDGKKYWDGLFSKNPPVQDFNVAPDLPDPDEVWVIKINPQERKRVPKSLNGIMDRRNELSGNLSLNAETRFIDQVNRWIDQGYLPDRYTHTDIHRIRLGRELDWSTKLDRRPEFLDGLQADGRSRAAEFLAAHDDIDVSM